MGFGYYDYYTTPVMHYVNYPLIMGIAAIIAAVLGTVVYFMFLKEKNENKVHGFKKTMYNLLTFNRFYAENIIKFVYVISAFVVTVTGIVMIILGSFVAGIVMLVIVNITLRVSFELLIMFIMLCKKTVSVDRRLSRIEDFYVENYGEDWGGEEFSDSNDENADEEEYSCSGCDVADELEDFHITPYEENSQSEEQTE